MQTYYLLEELQSLINGMKEKRVLTPQGDYYRPATIRNWKERVKQFEVYISTLEKETELSDINFRWFEDYRLYLLGQGYAKNSIANTLATLKSAIRRFARDGKMTYTGVGVTTSNELTTAIYVTIEDLQRLYNINLSQAPGMALVRDIFIMQCFLGLRVGDMMRLIPRLHLCTRIIDGKTFFSLKTAKTGTEVVIPAAKIVIEIAERNGYYLGRPFSQQYYSKTMKAIVERSSIDRDVIFNRTEGGVPVERIVRYSSLLGTHTARRTFATNAYLAGLNPLDIMKITGHKSTSSFFNYIRCDNLEVALKISDHDFFKITWQKEK